MINFTYLKIGAAVLALSILGYLWYDYSSLKSKVVKLELEVETYSTTIEKSRQTNKRLEVLGEKQKKEKGRDEELIRNRGYFDAN